MLEITDWVEGETPLHTGYIFIGESGDNPELSLTPHFSIGQSGLPKDGFGEMVEIKGYLEWVQV